MTARSRTVAIVDDTELIRDLLARVVEEQPDVNVCWTAGTAADAMRLSTQTPPDLMIVDLFLPDMNGDDLIRNVRQTLKPERTRILVLTGMLDHRRRDQSAEAGADACLQKGDDLNTLRTTIRKLAAA